MRDAPSNTDDVIDSRDVIARIEELTAERAALRAAVTDAEDELWDHPAGEEAALMSVIAEREGEFVNWAGAGELKALEALEAAAADYAPDWQHGATLIRESHFPAYARELVEDIGDVPKGLPAYIADNINWEGVADDLLIDYTTVNFDGVDYYVR